MNERVLTHKNIVLDYNKKALFVAGEDRALTKKEFLLLFKLMSSPETIFSRNQLLDDVWGYDTYSSERTVDVHINKLREKLDLDEIELVAMRGLGYKVVLV